MKSKLAIVFGLLLFAATSAWGAEDGAALYKKKCSGCHGANGEGKPSVNAPALKGTQKDVVEHLMKGEPDSKPPHNKHMHKLHEEQAKAIAEFVKTLQ